MADLTPRTVSSTRVELSQFVEPDDANFLGKAFGGSILSLIDLAAYASATKFAGNVCVTAAFDQVDFHHPIEVGEIVSCIAFVSYVGSTSVEVTIEVFAEDILTGTKHHTNTARVTMVALKDGRPTPVPRLICETREEKLRFVQGRVRRELRTRQRQQVVDRFAELESMSEAQLDALITG